MVIAEYTKHDYIFSNEGITQGDVTAMAIYALGIRPLIDNLGETVDHEKCKQSWYADDSSTGGQLTDMKTWWDQLCTMGPKYGYFPQASKTILIVKERFEVKAKAIFGKSGIKISTSGERHMGEVVGSERFKDECVSNKVEKWVQDIEQLSNIAIDEPQSALSSFTRAISHIWTYVQRTVPCTGHLFQSLEKVIREKLIPTLVGRSVSGIERRILALPVRLGGIGLSYPVLSAEREYSASVSITRNLANVIYNQDKDLTNYDKVQVESNVKLVKAQKERILQDEYNILLEEG